MTPEEKLNHLKDWVNARIEYSVEQARQFWITMDFYNELGVILAHVEMPQFPTFEQYLNSIK